MPKLDAAYIKHCAKYQSTLSFMLWSTDRKNAKKLMTMPESNVTMADSIIALSFVIANNFKEVAQLYARHLR